MTPNAQGVAEEFGGESACWRRMIEQVLAGVAAAALWMLGLLIATRIGGLPERVLLRSSSRCARAGPSSPAGCHTALRWAPWIHFQAFKYLMRGSKHIAVKSSRLLVIKTVQSENILFVFQSHCFFVGCVNFISLIHCADGFAFNEAVFITETMHTVPFCHYFTKAKISHA